MRSPGAIGPRHVAFEPVHARTIVLHPRSCCAPYVSFRGEDTYMPAGYVSGDIRRVVERVHTPELHSKSS